VQINLHLPNIIFRRFSTSQKQSHNIGYTFIKTFEFFSLEKFCFECRKVKETGAFLKNFIMRSKGYFGSITTFV